MAGRDNKSRFTAGAMNRLAAEVLHILPENDDDALAILDLVRDMMNVKPPQPNADVVTLRPKVARIATD